MTNLKKLTKYLIKTILIIGIIFTTGCSQKVIKNNDCYYPVFPSRNVEVKKELKKINNVRVDKWISEVIKYKEKIEVLKQ